MEFFESNSNVNLNMFAKVPSGMSDWVHNVPLQVDTTQFCNSIGDISLTASKDGIILNSTSVNCLSISRTLEQLSKESVCCRSQELLFWNFSVNYYQRIYGRIYIPVKFHALSTFF